MNLKFCFIILTKLSIVALSIYLVLCSGCGDTGVASPNNQHYPDCAKNRYHRYLRYQYFYMGAQGNRSFEITQRAKNEADFPYYDRCNTSINDTPSLGSYTSYRIINTNDGSDTAIRRALAEHSQNTRLINPGRFPFFVCGIDSLSADTYGGHGYSNSSLRYTYVFVGKINRRFTQDSTKSKNVGAILAHELGHQVGIFGHGGHVGGDTARCIMHRDIDNNMLWPYFTFCDNHACYIFAHVNDSDWYRPQAAGNKPTMQLNNELEVNISLDKSDYLEGENITLGLEIKNISGKEFRIRDLDHNFIHCNFKITNTLGKEAEYIGDIADNFFTSRYDTFKVDEARSYRLFLLDDYTSKRDNNYDLTLALGRIPGLLEEGNYKIVFGVMLDDSKALESNTINFTIAKPMGDELNAFDEIQRIFPMITRGSYIEKINRFREYIYKFPESVYMDQAFYCMMWLQMFPNSTNVYTFEDCNWFITKKPNSSVIDYAFWGIEDVFEKEKDSNGFKNYLQEIMNKHPDTKASALAQKFLADKFKK